MKSHCAAIFLIVLLTACRSQNETHPLVLQTDFGVKDGAVAAMKGVIIAVDPKLEVFDLTHEIPPFNIWEAAYRLDQTAHFWPAGTIFVSVVDPGVGTERKSVVLRTRTGHLFVTPDNGTLTLASQSLGIDEVREIDETVNRRQGSGKSYTFHGRDVYAYTAARLASGIISFEEVGKRLPDTVFKIPFQKPVLQGDTVKGNIPILDVQYGNVWTNIPDSLVKPLPLRYGDSVNVEISLRDSMVYSGRVPFVETFGQVKEGFPMSYLNSLMNFSLAINMGSFADTHRIKSGPEWEVVLYK